MFLIALVEKLMPEIQLAVAVFSMQQIILKKRYGISFSAGAITTYLLANKKWYSYWDFGFVGSKNGFTLGKSLYVKAIFRTHKSNATTSYLNA